MKINDNGGKRTLLANESVVINVKKYNKVLCRENLLN